MLLFLSFINSTSFKLKVCNSEMDYVQVPEISPFAANQKQIDMITEFTINSAYKYKKGFRILNLPKFNLCTSTATKSLFYSEKTGNDTCEPFTVVPIDYLKCFKIAFDDMCLAKNNTDGQLEAEVCQKDNTQQQFELVPSTKPNETKSVLNDSEKKCDIDTASFEKNGHLDRPAYEKIVDIHKLAKNISKCMTVNNTCNEHASESIPPTCFVNFSLAHYMHDKWAKEKLDEEHHEDDPLCKEKLLHEKMVKDDKERFESKYGNPVPNTLETPVTTENEINKIVLKEKNAKLINEMNQYLKDSPNKKADNDVKIIDNNEEEDSKNENKKLNTKKDKEIEKEILKEKLEELLNQKLKESGDNKPDELPKKQIEVSVDKKSDETFEKKPDTQEIEKPEELTEKKPEKLDEEQLKKLNVDKPEDNKEKDQKESKTLNTNSQDKKNSEEIKVKEKDEQKSDSQKVLKPEEKPSKETPEVAKKPFKFVGKGTPRPNMR